MTDAVVGDVSDGSVVQVAFEVGVEPSGQLLAITGTACSKSVAGQSWLNDYLKAARASGTEVQLMTLRTISASCLEALQVYLHSHDHDQSGS